MQLLARHNKILAAHLDTIAQHEEDEQRMQAHYLSWRSQNEFIEECGKSVVRVVVEEIRRSIYYSIITDGTPDRSHTEQVTFVFRYLLLNDDNQWEIKERFLKLEAMEKKKGSDIAQLIFDVLQEHQIDLKNCRGQGYDNASSMAGIYKGVQALVLRKSPQAFFVPCAAHSLNLCGVHAVESSVQAKSFFGYVQTLYKIFSCSPARWKILLDTAGVSLHKTSLTRWSARIEAIKPLAKRPREILEALRKLEELDLPAECMNEVKTLEKWMKSFEFVVFITLWFKTLTAVNDVSLLLQSTSLNLDDELKLIRGLLNDLQLIRSSWDNILDESKEVAINLGFETKFTEKRKRKKKSFHDEPKNTAYHHSDPSKAFEVEVFNVGLDTLIGQIKERFQAMERHNKVFFFSLVAFFPLNRQ